MLEQTKLPLLFILSLITSCLSSCLRLQSDCTNPGGEAGICISIMDCEELLNLVQKEDRTVEELKYLRASRCDVTNKKIKVCCKITDARCYNPDANPGLCVKATQCPAITKLLTPPILKEHLEFIRSSSCEGPAKYSVCCGPDYTTNATCVSSPAPPNPRAQCCGEDSSSGNRIFGGTEVNIDQYPWLAIIDYTLEKGIDYNTILLCGGALISSKYVLTAGHCVAGAILKSGKPENVRLGEYDISNDGPDCVTTSGGGSDCTYGSVIIPIQKIIPHRNYNPGCPLRRNDIALIRMTVNVQYNDFIKPICLPTSDITQSNQNLVLYAAGWGAVSNSESFSNIKQHVSLPYKPLEQCQTAYNVSSRKTKLWNGQMCAGGERGKDTCIGDSGGPLMYENSGIYSIVGVISFGDHRCALKGVPGVFTNVYKYMPWIRSNIKP